MNLSFTYESHNKFQSLTLFITVKTSTRLNLEHNDKWNSKHWSLWSTFSKTRTSWSFHVVVFQRTAKECTKNYDAHAQLLSSSLNLLFSNLAVAVVVFLNSLIRNDYTGWDFRMWPLVVLIGRPRQRGFLIRKCMGASP